MASPQVSATAALLAIAFVVWPIYVFPSGYPQPITIALLTTMLWALCRDPSLLASLLRQPELGLLVIFLAYTIAVNTVIAVVEQSAEPLLHSLFYVQVLVGCAVTLFVLRTESRAPQLIYLAVTLALMTQFVALLFTGITDGMRATLLFGNPNQLGLFALLSLGYLLLLHRVVNGSLVLTAVSATIAVVLVLVSLSKAAIASAIVMLALVGLMGPFRDRSARRLRPLLLLVIPLLLIALLVGYKEELSFIDAVVDRLNSIGQSSDDNLVSRGYSRIIGWPQYLLLGAGEGLVGRWNVNYEIHSMIGTLLFSYGLAGTVLVAMFLVLVLRRNHRDFIIFVVPILLYSLTHHPMRQPLMWSFFLLIAHCGVPARVRYLRDAQVAESGNER